MGLLRGLVPVVLVLVLEPFVIAAIMILVPTMVVGETAAVTFPVTVEEAFAVVMRRYPHRPCIRRTSPITFMPAVVSAYWIPISGDPDKLRTRPDGRNRHDPGRGRGADPDTD